MALIAVQRLGRRRRLTVLCVALIPVLYAVRVSMTAPLPYPVIHDEFSYVLGAETLALGRLTNPPHPLADHFVAPQILVRPTYASKYPIGQAAFLALGLVLFGSAHWGAILTMALCAGASVWATRIWTTRGWALISGCHIVLVFGLDHYWARSYWGGGVAFLGAILVLGAYGLTLRRQGAGAGAPLAAGMALLFFSRPYEGFCLTMAVFLAIAWHARKDPGLRPSIVRIAAIVGLIMVAAVAFQLRINYVVTGHAGTLPYVEHQRQYLWESPFWFRDAQRTPKAAVLERHREAEFQHYLHFHQQGALRSLRENGENLLRLLEQNVTRIGFLVVLLLATIDSVPAGLVLIPLAAATGLILEAWMFPHYAAPLFAAVWMLQYRVLHGITRLRLRRQRAGAVIAVAFLATATAGPMLRAGSGMLRPASPARHPRQNVEDYLRSLGGKHVVLVKRSADYDPHVEWVFNSANIDEASIVWARDLGAANVAVFAYYSERRIWECEPEVSIPGSALPKLTELSPSNIR